MLLENVRGSDFFSILQHSFIRWDTCLYVDRSWSCNLEERKILILDLGELKFMGFWST